MGKEEEIGGDEEIMKNYNKGVKGKNDDVVISIEKMLIELPPINSECFIYRVPKLRRMMKETAYTPHLISIGPFHYGQQQYKAAEQYKLCALKRYLSRINMSVGEAMNIAASWEETTRNFYADPIDMNSEEFVKMMLLDACFILEYMNTTNDVSCCLWGKNEDAWMDDSLLRSIMYDLARDLSMFENQLPFFVLQQLFDLSLLYIQNINKSPPINFMACMADLFSAITGGFRFPSNVVIIESCTHEARHLLDLLKFYYIPSSETNEYKKFKDSTQENNKYNNDTPTISELCEAGVKLQVAEDAQSLMDFSFENGVLKIPTFIIHVNFEIQIRNLIISEIFHIHGDNENYIFHYLALLDDLIKTEKDVSILVKEKILVDDIGGNNEQVRKLINDLRLNAPTYPTKYYYSNMSKDLNEYCKKWWHRSMASLRRDYFNTPWASISFLAATILLILTLLQTLFSAPSIFH